VRADDEVVAASEVRRLEERVRELERLQPLHSSIARVILSQPVACPV